MLYIENIDVSYGDIKILENVTLNVKEKEMVALIGSNGAGKNNSFKNNFGFNSSDKGFNYLFRESNS